MENVSSIIACSLVAGEMTCPHKLSPVYTAVTWQLVTCHNVYKFFVLQIELSPVDFVSRVIVGASQDVLHSAGKVFHIINPCTMDCRR
jgi:hypothetical protein